MKPSCGSTLQAGEPQGPSAKLAIRIFYGLVPAVLGGFSALVVFVLPLGRAQHRQSIGRWTGTGVSLNDLTLKIQFREEKQYKWNMYEHVISWFSVVVCFFKLNRVFVTIEVSCHPLPWFWGVGSRWPVGKTSGVFFFGSSGREDQQKETTT